MHFLFGLVLYSMFVGCLGDSGTIKIGGGGQTSMENVELPSKCDTCKVVARELTERLEETGKSHSKVGDKKYRDSEIRFIETVEGLCERVLTYSVHKEHKDSRRFAKGDSQTMQTLKNLRNKGVNVDLGIPEELWDSPSIEVAEIKRHCEAIMEEYEEELEEWFFKGGKQPLEGWLCADRVLRGEDKTCLDDKGTDKQHLKGDGGEKKEL